jgi:hypothetical protein
VIDAAGYAGAVFRVGIAMLAAACAAAVTSSAGAGSSPRSVRAAILDAASAEHSVHYEIADLGRNFRTTLVGDVAAGRGIQRIAVVRNGRMGHVTVLVVHSTVYLRGDAFALHAYMSFPAAQASRYAGRWVSISHTSPVYASVAADVTFGSFVSHLLPKHHLSVVHGIVGGKAVIGVHGTVREAGITVIETVYAAVHGSRLPLEATTVVHGTHGGTGRTTMSRWNEPVRLHAPKHATKI